MDWNQAFAPLVAKYHGKTHPLDYQGNRYHLIVMVLLSAQDSDRHINEVTKLLFERFPTMSHLVAATEGELFELLGSVQGADRKVPWLLKLAAMVGSDEAIPRTRKDLTKLPGIGPKSANVILRESGLPAEGIIVDLHVLRVAPRLGLSDAKDGTKMEKELMPLFDPEDWGEVGMAMSFLGRETCRPTRPHCSDCVMNSVCAYPNKTQ
jgi:endonuclease-3